MARFVFWNMARKPQLTLASAIIHQNQVDVFLTAEFGGEGEQLLAQINTNGRSFDFLPSRRTAGLTLFSSTLEFTARLLADLDRVSVYELSAIGKSQPLLLFLVHLPSKLYRSPDDQTAIASVLASDIRRFELEHGHRRTMVIGDFNMNPFENGMIGAREIHGMGAGDVAGGISRTVRGEQYSFFFNPTWSLLANRQGSAQGTYYYPGSGYYEHFWHTFDQVLVRPEIQKSFRHESLRVITMAGTARLLDSRGMPDKMKASDHLPIRFDFDL
ncbi:MAG: hypothetical protein C0504_09655 [Candidatus Solibacter sp.]|nr:hypothetical protein [Candidatus Solibacter sp.]